MSSTEYLFYRKHPNAQMPVRATQLSTGYDLIVPGDVALSSHTPTLVRLGFCARPRSPHFQPIDAQIRSRSGLALKNGIFVMNSPGTIDADYVDEWGVILYNSGAPHLISAGSRIAQLVVNNGSSISFQEVAIPLTPPTVASDQVQRKGGFGSTGT